MQGKVWHYVCYSTSIGKLHILAPWHVSDGLSFQAELTTNKNITIIISQRNHMQLMILKIAQK